MSRTDDSEDFFRYFVPDFIDRRKSYSKENDRFVHYTTAENAINIIRSKKIWMRNVKCMNDFMEIEHGFEILLKFFDKESNTREKFFKTMDRCWPGAAQSAIDMFDAWFYHIRNNTFVSCISEHAAHEDRLGRLSMWRAYGNTNVGAAIVVKNAPFNITDEIGIISSPILYLDENSLHESINNCLKLIDENCEKIKSYPEQQFQANIFSQILMYALCTKHPGFTKKKNGGLYTSLNCGTRKEF